MMDDSYDDGCQNFQFHLDIDDDDDEVDQYRDVNVLHYIHHHHHLFDDKGYFQDYYSSHQIDKDLLNEDVDDWNYYCYDWNYRIVVNDIDFDDDDDDEDWQAGTMRQIDEMMTIDGMIVVDNYNMAAQPAVDETVAVLIDDVDNSDDDTYYDIY